MKKEREHRVPCSAPAVQLLNSIPRFEGKEFVFAAPKRGQLSDMTLSAAMKRLHQANLEETGKGYVDRASKRPAVPHGLCSTFCDWVAERTGFPSDMAEVAPAHKVSNAVEAAYRRGDMIEKRRTMMQAWSDFVQGRDYAEIIIELQTAF